MMLMMGRGHRFTPMKFKGGHDLPYEVRGIAP